MLLKCPLESDIKHEHVRRELLDLSHQTLETATYGLRSPAVSSICRQARGVRPRRNTVASH